MYISANNAYPYKPHRFASMMTISISVKHVSFMEDFFLIYVFLVNMKGPVSATTNDAVYPRHHEGNLPSLFPDHMYTSANHGQYKLRHKSLVLRKPVFGVYGLVPHKPGCTATEDG